MRLSTIGAPSCRKNCSLRATVADGSLRPMNLSTAASSSRLLLVNSCAASLRPPVCTTAIRSFVAEAALDELPHRHLHLLRPKRIGVQIIQDDHVDAAIERLRVGAHVGLDRLLRKQRAIAAVDRDVDQREGADRLLASVFEDLKVVLREVSHEPAVRVGYQSVNLDILHLSFEGGLRRGRLLACGAGRDKAREGGRYENSSTHGS